MIYERQFGSDALRRTSVIQAIIKNDTAATFKMGLRSFLRVLEGVYQENWTFAAREWRFAQTNWDLAASSADALAWFEDHDFFRDYIVELNANNKEKAS